MMLLGFAAFDVVGPSPIGAVGLYDVVGLCSVRCRWASFIKRFDGNHASADWRSILMIKHGSRPVSIGNA